MEILPPSSALEVIFALNIKLILSVNHYESPCTFEIEIGIANGYIARHKVIARDVEDEGGD